MVFCIRKVKNASWLVTVTQTMQETRVLVVKLLALCLRLELEQFLGAAKGNQQCRCQQQKQSIGQQRSQLNKVYDSCG